MTTPNKDPQPSQEGATPRTLAELCGVREKALTDYIAANPCPEESAAMHNLKSAEGIARDMTSFVAERDKDVFDIKQAAIEHLKSELAETKAELERCEMKERHRTRQLADAITKQTELETALHCAEAEKAKLAEKLTQQEALSERMCQQCEFLAKSNQQYESALAKAVAALEYAGEDIRSWRKGCDEDRSRGGAELAYENNYYPDYVQEALAELRAAGVKKD